MGSKISKIYSKNHPDSYFIKENPCLCPTEFWKSYQMDLNIAARLLHHPYANVSNIHEMVEQEIVTVYFRCTNCEAEFPLAMFYFDGEFYRQYGKFQRLLTSNDRVSTVFRHNSLKNILFIISQKIHTSESYAIDLFKVLSNFEFL